MHHVFHVSIRIFQLPFPRPLGYLQWLCAGAQSPLIREVRGKGLFIGVEVDRDRIVARDVVDRLLARGILSKDTHGTVVRFAPPLTIDRATLDWAVEEVRAVFMELGGGLRRVA